MSDSPFSGLTFDAAARLDELCDDFEQAWVLENPPNILDYLIRVPQGPVQAARPSFGSTRPRTLGTTTAASSIWTLNGADQAKHKFRAGDIVSGKAVPVADNRTESVLFYKTSGLKVIERAADVLPLPPPWLGIVPELPVYRERGHRRLDARTYQAKCLACIWGCRMPVEMIIDQWNPGVKRYRFETFCYGPKSCSLYRAGPTRKVPGRKGMTWEEEDWVDEDATAHRSEDE